MMPTISKERQYTLPLFPPVARLDRLSGVHAWRGKGFTLGDSVLITEVLQEGTPVAELLRKYVYAHPYIRTIRTVRLDHNDPPGYFHDRTVRDFPVAGGLRAVDLKKLDLMRTPREKGPRRKRTMLGILSRVELDGGSEAHIPIMRFRRFTYPSGIAKEMSPAYPGYVLQDGYTGYYYIGRDPLPDAAWKEFLRYCERYTDHMDVEFADWSLMRNAGSLPLFGMSRHTTPRVSLVNASLS